MVEICLSHFQMVSKGLLRPGKGASSIEYYEATSIMNSTSSMHNKNTAFSENTTKLRCK